MENTGRFYENILIGLMIIVAAKGESFLATYSNDSKRSIEERFELMINNKTTTNLQNVKI